MAGFFHYEQIEKLKFRGSYTSNPSGLRFYIFQKSKKHKERKSESKEIALQLKRVVKRYP